MRRCIVMVIDKSDVEKIFDDRSEFWMDKGKYINKIVGVENRLLIELERIIAKNSYDKLCVADLGCGSGKITHKLLNKRENILVFAIDTSKKMITNLIAKLTNDEKEQVIPIIGDISKTTIDNNSCDIVLLQQVLHHVSDPSQVLKEAYRILKPNGLLILLCPAEGYQNNVFKYNSKELFDYLGRMNKDKMKYLCEEINFDISSIITDNFIFNFKSFDDYYQFMNYIGALSKVFKYKKVDEELMRNYLLVKCSKLLSKRGFNINGQYTTIIAKKVVR